MERSEKPYTIYQLNQAYKKGNFDLNSIIQRNEVWDSLKKSLLIHSILYDYPIPPLYTEADKDNSKLQRVQDGKQRIITFTSFLSDGFELHKNTPAYNGIEIAGKKFTELPDEFKEKIKGYSLKVHYFIDMTEDERDTMFLRLNGGKPLSRIELTRVEAGVDFMEWVREIAKNPFFSNQFTASQKNKFTNEEVVLQCINMVYNDASEGLSGKALSEMVVDLKQNPLSQEQSDDIQDVIEYLNVAFPEKEKFLKKVNIPVIFMLALQHRENVTPTDFFFKVKLFFENPTEAYSEAAQTGSAKAENVSIRIEELEKFITEGISPQQEEGQQEEQWEDTEEYKKAEQAYYQEEYQEEGQEEGQEQEQEEYQEGQEEDEMSSVA